MKYQYYVDEIDSVKRRLSHGKDDIVHRLSFSAYCYRYAMLEYYIFIYVTTNAATSLCRRRSFSSIIFRNDHIIFLIHD